MCMHFFRVQEFYESSDNKIRNKPFDFFDAMESYSKKYGNGAFTYTSDWGGFNIPGEKIEECFISCFKNINGFKLNKYDSLMYSTFKKIKKKSCNKKFYIIGCLSKDKETLKHEIAHAMYYLDDEYRKECHSLTKQITKSDYLFICKKLKSMGYHRSVCDDEIQAYFSTGLHESFKNRAKKYQSRYKKLFKKYYLKY